MMIIAFMLMGIAGLVLGMLIADYVEHLFKQRTMNKFRAEFGLQVRPYDFKYRR